MYLLRIFSIIASSVTLAMAIIAVAFASHYELHHHKEMRKYHPSRFWTTILDLAVSLVTTVGFSIALLMCSISWSMKWIEIILVLFERVLLIKEAQFLWKFLKGTQLGQSRSSTCTGNYPTRIYKFATNTIFEYANWIILCVSVCFLGTTIFISQELARTQHHEAMLKLSLILSAVEFLGLSGLYANLIWRAGGDLARYYQLTLAFITSFLPCMSASILFLLKLGYHISWPLDSWIHFGTVALWLAQPIIISQIDERRFRCVF